jgi:hypothetical protein
MKRRQLMVFLRKWRMIALNTRPTFLRILPALTSFQANRKPNSLIAWILVFRRRQPGLDPASPTAVHGFHLRIAHFLQVVGN